MKIKAYIGNEIAVDVHFDYQPEEKGTLTYSGVEASASITAIYVDGDEDKNIDDIISKKLNDTLEELCLDLAEWDQE